MSEFLSETEGCDLLARLFRARGYSIARNLLFREYGVEFHVDGWDAKARVGFEFLSSEDDDHDDLSLSEYQTLAAAQQRGELALFIIDEVEPLSAADLAEQAAEFLDEVEEARESRRVAGPIRQKAAKAKKRVAKKASGAKRKVLKQVLKKGVTRKPAARGKTATGNAVAADKVAKPRTATKGISKKAPSKQARSKKGGKTKDKKTSLVSRPSPPRADTKAALKKARRGR